MKILDNVVVVFLVIIILLIIIPLPPFLLDLVIVLNISISLVILLMTMYMKETLEFSIFPSVLLVTTLLRVSLNVSSTRLILLGQGGEINIIKAFGQFVVGNNAVVGIIIFLIIIIIQFIVITKGAERVAEVSARFTLDAMPGKQMAIDADLNSGLINEEQAKERRKKIQREADFFGAMDGATKFVKGDAIVSIIVVFINIIAGSIIGSMNGTSDLGTILNTYTILTVGDGLSAQIAALMISTATGIIVTRSASEQSLTKDLSKQFLSQPVVLVLAGAVLMVLLLIPGFPKIQLFVIGLALIILGVRLFKSEIDASKLVEAEGEAAPEMEVLSETSYYRNIENIYGLLNVEPVEMNFGYSLIPIIDENSDGNFVDRIVMFRKRFASEMGMVVPSVRLKDGVQLNPNQYVIKIKGEDVATGEVLVDHMLAMDPGGAAQEIEGIGTIEPAFGIPAKWVRASQSDAAELAGYSVIDPVSVIITHFSEIIKRHAHELFGRQEVAGLLDNVKKINKAVVEDVVPDIIKLGDLQKVLANLLREQIPIKDMVTILETIGDYGQSVKDLDVLTEYVRQALRRTITRRFVENGKINVITVDPELEKTIMSSVRKTEQGSYMALEPEAMQRIAASLESEADKLKELMITPVVLTSPMVRIYFKKLIEQFMPNAAVLSFSEIEASVQIQAFGTIKA